MALKLPDSAVPMGDFPVAKAVDIDFDDGENLQEKLDNGTLGGGAVDPSGYVKTYTTLDALGLIEPVTVGEIFNAMVDNTTVMMACEDIANHIKDVPMSYGVLIIKKKNNSRFSIEYQNSLGGSAANVKRWIGTLKGTDGSGLYWKELKSEVGEVITSDTIAKYGTEILKYPIGKWLIDSTNIGEQLTDLPYAKMAGVIEIDSIQPNKSPYEHAYGYRNYTFRDALSNTVYTRSLNSGNTAGAIQRDSGWCTTGSHFYKLSNMYLTVNATIQEVIDAVPIGSTAILRTDEFANWSTLFNGIQWGYLKIEKTVNGLSNIELQEVVTPNRRYFGTQSSGKFSAWVCNKDKTTAAFNSKTFKIDITKGNANWNGNMKFGYCVDESYGEIIISSLGKTGVMWDHSTGVHYVKSVTYTIDPDNKAHVTIGVELYDTAYGIHQLETCGDFATINSLTGDAFTGTSIAKRGATRGRNNGVGILCEVGDLGLTFPCTTVQIAQAMAGLTKSANRIPVSGMIGIFENFDKTITDVPTSYGLLQVNAYGQDRMMIRYDGVSNSSHTGSWIGQIKGSDGTFSSITWSRIDLEAQVNELFQSVSSGKTLVANAITGKGVSTATNATFATMATNIGKISGGYKEETKTLIVTSGTTGTEALPFTFSANVIAVKKIVAPSESCRIVPQTSKDMLTINGKELVLYVAGTGTWKVTALIEK